MDEPICVLAMLTAAGESVTGWSTLGRELAFVNSHTIHHKAMIAVLLSHACRTGMFVTRTTGSSVTPPARSSAVDSCPGRDSCCT